MKIPKKIKVLGVEYKIEQVDSLKHIEEGYEATGQTVEAQRKIRLSTCDLFCESQKEQTLFHELAHVVLMETGLARTLSDCDNEVYAQCFGNAFHQIFKQML